LPRQPGGRIELRVAAAAVERGRQAELRAAVVERLTRLAAMDGRA